MLRQQQHQQHQQNGLKMGGEMAKGVQTLNPFCPSSVYWIKGAKSCSGINLAFEIGCQSKEFSSSYQEKLQVLG